MRKKKFESKVDSTSYLCAEQIQNISIIQDLPVSDATDKGQLRKEA